MNEPCDLDDPYVKWCDDIWRATRGDDVSRLIAALRSERPLDALAERMLRDCLAALLAGEHKRRRGQSKRRVNLLDAIEPAETLVRRLKKRAR